MLTTIPTNKSDWHPAPWSLFKCTADQSNRHEPDPSEKQCGRYNQGKMKTANKPTQWWLREISVAKDGRLAVSAIADQRRVRFTTQQDRQIDRRGRLPLMVAGLVWERS